MSFFSPTLPLFPPFNPSFCRDGTMSTSPGILVSFVELIMCLFPLKLYGSPISQLKKCKHAHTHTNCVQQSSKTLYDAS